MERSSEDHTEDSLGELFRHPFTGLVTHCRCPHRESYTPKVSSKFLERHKSDLHKERLAKAAMRPPNKSLRIFACTACLSSLSA